MFKYSNPSDRFNSIMSHFYDIRAVKYWAFTETLIILIEWMHTKTVPEIWVYEVVHDIEIRMLKVVE